MADYICENCGKGGMLQFSFHTPPFWGKHHVCAKCYTALTKRDLDLEDNRRPLRVRKPDERKEIKVILPVGKLAPNTIIITRTADGWGEEIQESKFKGEER